jgi:hypothetical protein
MTNMSDLESGYERIYNLTDVGREYERGASLSAARLVSRKFPAAPFTAMDRSFAFEGKAMDNGMVTGTGV